MAESAAVASGHGSGKLLLFGEHSAVYGYPALGISLAAGTTIFRGSHPPPDARPVPALVRGQLDLAVEAIAGALREAGCAPPPSAGDYSYSSDLPMGSGFGSSAAACVALARLLAPAATPLDQLWRAANRGEAIFHGSPSGIDTGLALGGGIFALDPVPGDIPRRRRLPSSEIIVVAGTVPRRKTTRELVAAIGELRKRDRTGTETLLHRLGELTREAIGLTDREEGLTDLAAFAEAATEAHAVLSRLNLSTEEVDGLLAAARRAGAAGGKISGAGGGGAFYIVTDDPEIAFTVRDALDTAPGCTTLAPLFLGSGRRAEFSSAENGAKGRDADPTEPRTLPESAP